MSKEEKIQYEWCKQFILTPEQFKKQVEEKLKRIEQYHIAVKKREEIIASSQ